MKLIDDLYYEVEGKVSGDRVIEITYKTITVLFI